MICEECGCEMHVADYNDNGAIWHCNACGAWLDVSAPDYLDFEQDFGYDPDWEDDDWSGPS